MIENFARAIFKAFNSIGNEVMQKASYELGDMLNAQDPLSRLFYLAEMKLTFSGVYELLDEREKRVIDFIVAHSEMTFLPVEFDPRKEEDNAQH